MTAAAGVAAVVIGRNEGDRLRRCLESIAGRAGPCVYVDSGSTDGSVRLARAAGVEVTELDTSIPFSAARARNAGFDHVMRMAPGTRLVQFVDGDCEVLPSWIERASSELEAAPEAAVVCGYRREARPDASVYNRLCDLEWSTSPAGDVASCGGDFLARADAFAAVGGFDPSVVAGEEPELCFRLRRAGYKIRRLASDMTRHDAAMSRFGQWWRRMERAGHACAQGMSLHGRSAERFGVRRCLRGWTWSVAIPVSIGALGWWIHPVAAVAASAAFPIQWLRISARNRRLGATPPDARIYALACLVATFPQVVGQVRFWLRCARGRRPRILEYKNEAKRSETRAAAG